MTIQKYFRLMAITVLLVLVTLIINPSSAVFADDYTLARDFTAVTETPLSNYPVTEGFEDIDVLEPTYHWIMQNSSFDPGRTNWFQGNSAVFSAHAGGTEGYIAANFRNTNGGEDAGSGVISNWLISPPYLMQDGDVITFWTRTSLPGLVIYPDRMQVRISTNGLGSDTGEDAFGVGDFSTLLLDINPEYVQTSDLGYPNEWTEYEITLDGISSSQIVGRIAFRYFVEDSGPLGQNSNYIGIDSYRFTGSPTAVTVANTSTSSVTPTTIMPLLVVLFVGALCIVTIQTRRSAIRIR